jgi:hypothetical protein
MSESYSNIGLFAVVRLMSSPRLSLLEGLAFLANASLMVSWLFASLLPFFHSVKNGLTVINIQLRKYKSYSNRCSGKILQIPTFFEILYSPICFRINAYVPYICFYIFHSRPHNRFLFTFYNMLFGWILKCSSMVQMEYILGWIKWWWLLLHS